jgi:signal peptidase I
MSIQLVTILVFVCLVIIAFVRFNFTITTVHGDSMFPTLAEGDRLLSFNFLPHMMLRKGQIVIGKINELEVPSSGEEFLDIDTISEVDSENIPLEPDCSKFIKRIVGLPGDTVCIPISSLHEFMQTELRSHCDEEGNLVWKVPENHCFVRGDGLISMDSLAVGPIPLSAITGIVVLKLLPHSDLDSVQQLRGASDVRQA